jgi:hypothetical protein
MQGISPALLMYFLNRWEKFIRNTLVMKNTILRAKRELEKIPN